MTKTQQEILTQLCENDNSSIGGTNCQFAGVSIHHVRTVKAVKELQDNNIVKMFASNMCFYVVLKRDAHKLAGDDKFIEMFINDDLSMSRC